MGDHHTLKFNTLKVPTEFCHKSNTRVECGQNAHAMSGICLHRTDSLGEGSKEHFLSFVFSTTSHGGVPVWPPLALRSCEVLFPTSPASQAEVFKQPVVSGERLTSCLSPSVTWPGCAQWHLCLFPPSRPILGLPSCSQNMYFFGFINTFHCRWEKQMLSHAPPVWTQRGHV